MKVWQRPKWHYITVRIVYHIHIDFTGKVCLQRVIFRKKEGVVGSIIRNLEFVWLSVTRLEKYLSGKSDQQIIGFAHSGKGKRVIHQPTSVVKIGLERLKGCSQMLESL